MNEGRRQFQSGHDVIFYSHLRLFKLRCLRIIFLALEKPIGRTSAKLEEIFPAKFEPRVHAFQLQ
jgi:hypothetical protein